MFGDISSDTCLGGSISLRFVLGMDIALEVALVRVCSVVANYAEF